MRGAVAVRSMFRMTRVTVPFFGPALDDAGPEGDEDDARDNLVIPGHRRGQELAGLRARP